MANPDTTTNRATASRSTALQRQSSRARRCEFCGKEFSTTRASARCCSDRCRFQRWKGQQLGITADDLCAVFGSDAVERVQHYYLTRNQ